jgi:hypothetical protein
LPPSALADVLAAAEGERFFDLPCEVGRSFGPESSPLSIRIRTALGSRSVVISGPCERSKNAHASDDTCDRANRVLHSIPHAETWVVTGH